MADQILIAALAIAYAIAYIVWQRREVERYRGAANAMDTIIRGLADGHLQASRDADGMVHINEKKER